MHAENMCVLQYFTLSQGKEVKDKVGLGALCIRNPWPGVARTIYGDHNRFLDTYFRPYPGKYNLDTISYRNRS